MWPRASAFAPVWSVGCSCYLGWRRRESLSQFARRLFLAKDDHLAVELRAKSNERIAGGRIFIELRIALHRYDHHRGAVVVRHEDFSVGIHFVNDVAPAALNIRGRTPDRLLLGSRLHDESFLHHVYHDVPHSSAELQYMSL